VDTNLINAVFKNGKLQAVKTAEEICELIEAHRSGHKTAGEQLLHQYAAALTGASYKFLRQLRNSGRTGVSFLEVVGVLTEAFFAYINEVDLTTAGEYPMAKLRFALSDAVRVEYRQHFAASIDAKELKTYMEVMALARLLATGRELTDADVEAARVDRSHAHISAQRLEAIRMLHRSDDLEVAAELPAETDEAAVEDRIISAAALASLTDTEATVIRMACGFEGEVLNDGLIAERLGWSCSKTQRVRAAALAKMRLTLGVVEQPRPVVALRPTTTRTPALVAA
jgi:hypothetical protein